MGQASAIGAPARGYLCPVLRASTILADLSPEDRRVFIDAAGLPSEAPGPVPWGDAVVVAIPAVDAIKVVEGGRVGKSLDRDGVLRAVGFVLSRQVLVALGSTWIDPGVLYGEVAGLGFNWQVSIVESP